VIFKVVIVYSENQLVLIDKSTLSGQNVEFFDVKGKDKVKLSL
jgi:hypothetical protein